MKVNEIVNNLFLNMQDEKVEKDKENVTLIFSLFFSPEERIEGQYLELFLKNVIDGARGKELRLGKLASLPIIGRLYKRRSEIASTRLEILIVNIEDMKKAA